MHRKILSISLSLILAGMGQQALAADSATDKEPAAASAGQGNQAAAQPKKEKAKKEKAKQPPAPVTLTNETVVVTVNGTGITLGELGAYLSEKPGAPAQDSTKQVELQNRALQELINLHLLSSEAEAAGLDKDPGVVSTLQLQKKKIYSQRALQHYVDQHAPTEDDLKKAYQERVAAQASKEYKARHILLEDQEQARALVEKLNNGADFAALAQTHSTGPSASSGGDLGWFEPGQMVEPFSKAVMQMEKGQFTHQPVKTQFGWHVILLEDIRDKTPPPFDSVKDKLAAQLQQEAMSHYLAGLRQDANVEYNQAILSEAKEAPQAAADTAEQK